MTDGVPIESVSFLKKLHFINNFNFLKCLVLVLFIILKYFMETNERCKTSLSSNNEDTASYLLVIKSFEFLHKSIVIKLSR